MARNKTTVAQRFAEVVAAMSENPAVSTGSGRKGFGSSALQVNGKIFAMLTSREQFVVKLPRQRVAALVASGDGKQFDPGHGRLMKEWLALVQDSSLSWASLAEEAFAFVRGQS